MILCFALFLAAVIVSLVSGHRLVLPLLLGLALFFLLGRVRGFSSRSLAAMAWGKGRESLIVIPVFLIIGMLTGLWRSSGTIAFFLYHGLRSISPAWFVLMAFLLSALLSLALGTSFGVTGTAGVVLITLARTGGVDPAVTAGAIVSGAYFGDRCSPMSSCASLVAACTGTELYPNVREMLRTGALPTVLTAALYALISLRNPITTVDAEVLSALSGGFSLHILTLLPAALMLLLPLLKIPVKRAMAASAVTAFVLTVCLQGLPLWDTVKTAVFGYTPPQPELTHILSGGGLVSMVSSSVIVFITSLYAGILEGIDALASAKHRIEKIAARLGLFPAAAIVSTAIAAVFCNQSVTVLMGAQLLADSYRRRNASGTELAMDIANSGVTISGLLPWSIAISVPLSMLDVGNEAIPWCILLYMIPLCYLFTKRYFRAGQNPAQERI